jgi:hypothetical protein
MWFGHGRPRGVTQEDEAGEREQQDREQAGADQTEVHPDRRGGDDERQ